MELGRSFLRQEMRCQITCKRNKRDTRKDKIDLAQEATKNKK